MAPFLSYGQSIIDEYNKQRLVEEYLKERGQPIDGSSPPIHARRSIRFRRVRRHQLVGTYFPGPVEQRDQLH